MKLKNALALPTAMVIGKGADLSPFLALVIKGTFRLEGDGRPAPLAQAQLPVLGADQPYDPDKPGGLLRFESDCVPFKPRCDVVLVGSAYAPRGRPVAVLDVGIRVGPLDRTLRVVGDRRWVLRSPEQPEPVITPPAPFTQMPLTYDRAFGGVDEAALADAQRKGAAPWCPRNWFGRGYIASRTVASIDGRPLANLEDPAAPVFAWDSRPQPVGCGFFPRNSEPRVRFFGTYDDAWRAHRAPEPPVDFRFDAYSGADPSLQVEGYLRGNDAVVLQHVDPERPVLSLHLPCLKPVLTVDADRTDAGGAERTLRTRVEARLDTLVFVPDEKIFYQVWRAIVPVRDPGAPGVRQIQIDYERLPLPEAAGDGRVARERPR